MLNELVIVVKSGTHQVIFALTLLKFSLYREAAILILELDRFKFSFVGLANVASGHLRVVGKKQQPIFLYSAIDDLRLLIYKLLWEPVITHRYGEVNPRPTRDQITAEKHFLLIAVKQSVHLSRRVTVCAQKFNPPDQRLGKGIVRYDDQPAAGL